MTEKAKSAMAKRVSPAAPMAMPRKNTIIHAVDVKLTTGTSAERILTGT